MPSLSSRKRLLIVAKTGSAVQQRSEFLRRHGYEVDCATGLNSALNLTRTHSYDMVVLTFNGDCANIKKVASQIQKLNPNTLVTCLANTNKIPPLPSHRMLWTGEPLEYFLARVEALAATA